MTGYTKLFGSIVNSTVWCAPDRHRIVWITMLAMADMDGVIDSSIPGLAKAANVPLEDVELALESFKNPDPYSRTPDFDGRRIEAYNDGQRSGWVLLNHSKYKAARDREERREYNRKWMAEKRAGDKAPQESTVDNGGQSGSPLAGVGLPRPSSIPKDQEPGASSASAARQPAKVPRGAQAKGTRLTADWQPDDEDKAYATSQQVEWKKEAENFRDYWIARAGAGGVKLDWKATWRTWCRRAEKTLSAPSKAPVGSKAALARSESKLDHALSYARQQFERGDFGEGEVGQRAYASEVKTIKLRHGVKP